MKEYNWQLDIDTFSKKARTIRSPQYCEDYFNMHRKHQIGCHYYLYLDEDLNVINPYTKKDENKAIFKQFISTFSREDVIKQAYYFIKEYAENEGLFSL